MIQNYGLTLPWAMSIDFSESAQRLYRADYVQNRIEKSMLDGSIRETVSTSVSQLFSMDLDTSARRIYWTSWSANTVYSSDYQGGDVQTIYQQQRSNGIRVVDPSRKPTGEDNLLLSQTLCMHVAPRPFTLI